MPVASWLWLRGKCRSCGKAIGARQFWVELGTALAAGIPLCVSPDSHGVLGAIFSIQLVALALFDAETGRLPHILSALLAVSGLLGTWWLEPEFVDGRLLGGILGFGGLWLVGQGYWWLRQRRGLGGGDAPFLGAIGCWIGWQGLPLVLAGASLLALAMVLARRASGARVSGAAVIRFGPYLALAGWLSWLILVVRNIA